MQETQCPIGIFDSGIGGLTVAQAIVKLLPNEQLIYFGDTAHMPYGEKSAEAIQQYSLKISEFLIQKKCKIIVIACSTASAVAYETLVKQISGKIPVINVIDPVVDAVLFSGIKSVGVLATQRTTKSNVYPEKLRQRNDSIYVTAKATGSLASIIEEGMYKSPDTMKAIMSYYLSDNNFSKPEGIILGCTHYPLIKQFITDFYKYPISIFDSTETVAKVVKDLLADLGLLSLNFRKEEHHFYVSDYTQTFEDASKIFFGEQIHLNHYPIWEL
ncbi:MAG: glutamate racemase [Sphingobacteriales bacterium]|nr:MAG: glutamate racemase [Sphingobacteriales bacterium]